MSNSKDPSSMRNMMYHGRNSLLPPKSPFPCPAPSYVDYVPPSAVGHKGTMKVREGNSNHQRTSSESLLIEEQPSWLDELLNEPETPVRRGGHRRSSSDSFAYIDAANIAGIDFTAQDDIRFNNMMPLNSWGAQDFDHYRDARHPFVPDVNSFGKHKNRAWDASSNSFTHLRGFPPSPANILQSSVTSRAHQETEVFPTNASEKQNGDSDLQDVKGPSEKKDADLSNGKPSACETDTKRAKQQFAQRSRVRKLQYIAELERNVQALQAEGSEVSAELEFLNQQHLILSMENKALKQRLESLAQEQLIKYVEQDVLERELGRLRSLYQQLQQPMQQHPPKHQTSGHRRSSSKDLDIQLANLSLKQKDTSSVRDQAARQLNI